jgi:hypothetical protein
MKVVEAGHPMYGKFVTLTRNQKINDCAYTIQASPADMNMNPNENGFWSQWKLERPEPVSLYPSK